MGLKGLTRALDDTSDLTSYLRKRHHECKHSTRNETTDQFLLVADRWAANAHVTLVHDLQPVPVGVKALLCNEPVTS